MNVTRSMIGSDQKVGVRTKEGERIRVWPIDAAQMVDAEYDSGTNPPPPEAPPKAEDEDDD